MSKQNAPRHYQAFISYRHTFPDQQIAKILHFLLEHNITRPERGVPRRIRPVFLDTSELPTSEDLNQDIQNALNNSECLYVICSPNLPLSKYCMAEIRYFKEKCGGSMNRIHTLLVAGEPGESFPEELRTTVRRTVGADGTLREELVEAEPLFADVRGKNLFHSILKLLGTEYLRLAAAYYKCPYDKLFKRNLRWRVGVATLLIAAMTAGGLGLNAYRNTLAANHTASVVSEILTEKTPELTGALTLFHETRNLHSEQYEVSLRSAVVQYDAQKNDGPIGVTPLGTYPDTGAVNRYLSREGNQLLIHTSEPNGRNRIMQITDAHTGQIHLLEAQERVFVVGDNPSNYLMLRSHTDENGVMMDYVSVLSLTDNSLISEFAYRESSRDSASYTLIRAVECEHLLTVTDGREFVAFLTLDGTQLTREEYIEIAKEYVGAPLPEEDAPYRLARSRQQYLLKDAADNVLLRLDADTVDGFDFSGNWTHFCWLSEGKIHVFDLTAQQEVGVSRCPAEGGVKLILLDNSSYYAAVTLTEQGEMTTVYDWNTGKKLLSAGGVPLFSSTEQAFFLLEEGRILRYDYRHFPVSEEGTVIAHRENRRLSQGFDSVRLLDTDTAQVLLNLSAEDSRHIAWDKKLEHILHWHDGTVACYSGDGTLLWEQAAASGRIAMAEDGTVAAWATADGGILLADAGTGKEIAGIPASALSEAGQILSLAVSQEGACVIGDQGNVFYRLSDGTTVCTERYSHAMLTNGLLILSDEDARVRDFAIYRLATGEMIFRPDSNTAQWVYSAESGYLVRHTEESGNNASLQLEVLKQSKNGFTHVAFLPLPSNYVQRLHLDGTGQWLSIVSNGRTQVYDLKSMDKWLDAEGSLYYEADSLYGCTAYGPRQYCFTPGDTHALRDYVRDAISGSWGIRTLTEQEKERYSLD